MIYFKPDLASPFFYVSVHLCFSIQTFSLLSSSFFPRRVESSGSLHCLKRRSKTCRVSLETRSHGEKRASFKRPRSFFIVRRKCKAGAALRVSSFPFCCRRENCVWKLPLLSGTPWGEAGGRVWPGGWKSKWGVGRRGGGGFYSMSVK